MKKCPYCAEDIQDAAVVCKHCGRDLTTGAVPTAAPTAIKVASEPAKRKTSIGTLGCATIVVLLLVGYCVSLFNRTPTPPTSSTTPKTAESPAPVPAPAPAPPANELGLLSSRGYESEGGGYFIVEGEVQNISKEPLKSVNAVATWYTKDGTFISSDSALVQYDPLLPGQKSPFKTMTRANPQMSKYTIAFKHLFGSEIPTDDRRKSGKK